MPPADDKLIARDEGRQSVFRTCELTGRTMDETTGNERKQAPDDAGREARDRARAYLDLWESHLVQTALHGPGPGVVPGSAPATAATWRPTRS